MQEREIDGRKIPALLSKNPVDELDMSLIGDARPKKPPLNLPAVDRAAAAILNPADRLTSISSGSRGSEKTKRIDFDGMI